MLIYITTHAYHSSEARNIHSEDSMLPNSPAMVFVTACKDIAKPKLTKQTMTCSDVMNLIM